LEVIEADQDDNRVLECAVASSAAYIISGDEHLLELKDYNGITVLPAAGFLRLLD
jgi:predicted nucleic acid-binding protein